MTLTEFLLARIAEDEAVIGAMRHAIDEHHVGRWESDRLTAECEAKRRIVADHKIITVWPDGTGGAKFYTGGKRVCASCDERTPAPCRTLQHLSLPYADHPDYRQEWKP